MMFADNRVFSSEKVDLNSFALEIEPLITEITKPLGIRLYWDLQADQVLIVNKKQLSKLIINLIYYLTNNYPAIKLLTLQTECNKQGVILKVTAKKRLGGLPKRGGQGSLELALCYAIAQKHNAVIQNLINHSSVVYTIIFPQCD